MVVVNRPTARAMGCTVRSICMASSRVGARIRARGLRPSLRPLPPSFSIRRSTSGCAEGDRLAGAGLAATEHVFSGEHVGDGRGLDRERAERSHRLQLAHDVVAETEVLERHTLDLDRGDGLGLEALEHDVVDRSVSGGGAIVALRVEVRATVVAALRAVAVRRTLGASRAVTVGRAVVAALGTVTVRGTLAALRTVTIRRTLRASRAVTIGRTVVAALGTVTVGGTLGAVP